MIILHTLEYVSPKDIYGRQAMLLSQRIGKLESEILIEKVSENRNCDAKSLLGLLSLGIKAGDRIYIHTDSESYSDIFDSIIDAIESD